MTSPNALARCMTICDIQEVNYIQPFIYLNWAEKWGGPKSVFLFLTKARPGESVAMLRPVLK